MNRACAILRNRKPELFKFCRAGYGKIYTSVSDFSKHEENPLCKLFIAFRDRNRNPNFESIQNAFQQLLIAPFHPVS